MVPAAIVRNGDYFTRKIKRRDECKIWTKPISLFLWQAHTFTTNRIVQDYQDQFEKQLAKARPLEQARQVNCFVGGLRELIHTDVKANKLRMLSSKPTNLIPCHQPLGWPDYMKHETSPNVSIISYLPNLLHYNDPLPITLQSRE